MTTLRAIALAASMVMVAGCISHRERQRVYTLGAAADAPSNTEAGLRRPELQLQRVLVPDYLDTTDLVLRVGVHEIRESSTGRFGERLSLGITHGLRSDLAARLPLDTISLAQPAEKSARQILVTVEAFDVWQNGRCVLTANWSIVGADRAGLPTADKGTFVTASAGGDISNDAAIVSSMAEAVRQLADRIASTIKSLPR
jgi:uncharacterized protein